MELIEATWAAFKFAVKESGCPSVCTGGRENDTDEELDELEELEDPDELGLDVAVDDSSLDFEELLSSSSSSSSDNSSSASKSMSMASKSGMVPGGTSILPARSVARLTAHSASPSASPTRFLIPPKRSLLNLRPPPPQALTFGGIVPPRFLTRSTALSLKSSFSFKACVLMAGIVIERPQALPWEAQLAARMPSSTASE